MAEKDEQNTETELTCEDCKKIVKQAQDSAKTWKYVAFGAAGLFVIAVIWALVAGSGE